MIENDENLSFVFLSFFFSSIVILKNIFQSALIFVCVKEEPLLLRSFDYNVCIVLHCAEIVVSMNLFLTLWRELMELGI